MIRGERYAGMTSSDLEEGPDERATRHRDLEAIALTALDIGRILMESGARARMVDRYVVDLALAFGVDRAYTRAGYASLEMTVEKDHVTSTRMIAVGYHGVNQRLDQAIRQLVLRAAATRLTPPEVEAEVARLAKTTPHHPHWLMALAAGIACAAFGRLLGADWAAALAVLIASAVGQGIRTVLRLNTVNVYIITMTVAFVASALGGVGAALFESRTQPTAMVAAILLLVPGVPALNALSDIMEGRPTLGSARAVSVAMIMVFAAIGLWLGGILLNVGLAR
jgi:uncharacterized membrane protein YjjP (DUF1212 family)